MMHRGTLYVSRADAPYAECLCGWSSSSTQLLDVVLEAQQHRRDNEEAIDCELAEHLGRAAQEWLHLAGRHSSLEVIHDHERADPDELEITIRGRITPEPTV